MTIRNTSDNGRSGQSGQSGRSEPRGLLGKKGKAKAKPKRNPLKIKKQWYEPEGVSLEAPPPMVEDLSLTDKLKLREGAKERVPKVMEMFFDGKSVYMIAQQLEVPASVVRKDVVNYLSKAARQYEDVRDNYTQLQLARYHRMLAHWWPIAQMAHDGNVVNIRLAKIAIRAQEQCNRLMSDINKLLSLGSYGDEKPRLTDGPINLTFFKQVIVGRDPKGEYLMGDPVMTPQDRKLLVENVVEGDFVDVIDEIDLDDSDDGDRD